MPDYHDDVHLYAGDDWTILGTLFDEQGNPLDLTNATITWVGARVCAHHDVRARPLHRRPARARRCR